VFKKITHLQCTYAKTALEGIAMLKSSSFDLIFCDLELKDLSGLDIVQVAQTLHPESLSFIITPQSKLDKALYGIRLGAFQYLVKPLSIEAVDTALEKATKQRFLLEENECLKKEISYSSKKTTYPMIVHSPAMQKIINDLPKIAKSHANVFIMGESGTGKEVLASAIHSLSSRSHKPFVRVNCAAIAESLLESEFFGHEKGAFTGALQKRMGRFELADLGTLLLDEISEISLEVQPKLLRAIQEKEFERVGGTKPIRVDVRLIATSNRNMQETVEKKLFREDLFFRLHVIPITIPPLRERKEDIAPLAKYFLEKFCKENNLTLKQLSRSAEEKLCCYLWPGNVRELANVMERTIIMHTNSLIDADDLKLEFACEVPPPKKVEIGPIKPLSLIEKEHILTTLKHCCDNKTKAAEMLQISLRTLRNKLRHYQTETS
jgi:two-component system response regulator AtoC